MKLVRVATLYHPTTLGRPNLSPSKNNGFVVLIEMKMEK